MTPGTAPLAVNHQGQFPAVTVSFNLVGGESLGKAVDAIVQAGTDISLPPERARRLLRLGSGVQLVPGERAGAHPRRAHHRLHRAGRALRELHPPDHHPLDPPVGGHRRLPRAHAVSPGVQRHRADRDHPADRHREEERHHDDRLRSRGGARPGAEPAGVDLPGVPPALPPDHDDHPGRAARRRAAGARQRHRLGAAPAARHQHRRRADHLADPDAVHHAGRLSVHGAARRWLSGAKGRRAPPAPSAPSVMAAADNPAPAE